MSQAVLSKVHFLASCRPVRPLPWRGLLPGNAQQRYSVTSKAAFHASLVNGMPMKPGTPIPGLDFYKDGREPPVALPREEYPAWVDTLTKPLISLAQLRKMNVEEATDKERRRFLKLTRRMKIRQNNAEAAARAK